MTIYNFPARKATGDAAEDRIRRELERRGAVVDDYGQGVFSEQARRVLKRSKSLLRWNPDFVVTWGQSMCLVDAKTSMRGDDADRYTISREALTAHMRLLEGWNMPLFYIFSNMGIATLHDIMRFCRLWSVSEITGGYVSFPADMPGHLDDVFGPPEEGGVLARLPTAA